MCVIFSTFGVDPPQELLEEGARRNSDGAGVAWQDNGGAIVRWKKGINDVEEIIEMIKKGLPHPYMIHFRKKSIGEAAASLTHPFPLDPDVPTALEGETTKGVLAHNGTWHMWDKDCRPAIFGLGRPVPGGLWNDSRMLTYITAHYGVHALQFLDWGHNGRIGILYPHAQRVLHFNSNEWTKKEGFWMSQDMESKIISVSYGESYDSKYPGYQGYRASQSRFEALSTLVARPKPCPKCGKDGIVNFNMSGRQWCKDCANFFEIAESIVEADSEKKGMDAPPTKTQEAQTSSEVIISSKDLHRIVGYMFSHGWWLRGERRVH